MARGGRPRPPPFPVGTKIGDHYQVEALVRLAEGRMFYLLNDDRPEQPKRRCPDCQHDGNSREAERCAVCDAPLKDRKFLMSVRWDPRFFAPFEEFFKRRLVHPAVISPIDVLRIDTVLCSVVPYRGETLLIDESSPLPFDTLLHFAQRSLGAVAFLQHNGVQISRLAAAHFLLDSNQTCLLFDLDISALHDEPLSADLRKSGVEMLVRVLRKYVPVNSKPLWDMIHEVDEGRHTDTFTLGEALQSTFGKVDPPPPPVGASAITDVGLIRDLNEDNWAWTQLAPDIYLYVVADGMGGHDSGEVASFMASSTICRVAQERTRSATDLSVETLENILDEAFQTANNTVKENAEERGNDMGTTLVALMIVHNELALLANVGDSRGYLLRDKVLHRVTRDHSLVQRMVDQNRITDEEARNHPHSNILLRTVGTERNVEIDIYSVEIEEGDHVLLCSDGLWGEVEDDDIEAILNHYPDLRTSSRELVRAAHHGGGKDNVTLLIVGNRGPAAA